MNFLDELKKTISKMEGVTTNSSPPRYWFTTGNYVLNRVLSGSFYKGIPQGRITALCGPSTAGKSFLLGNILKGAQDSGAIIVVIDSEGAFDDDFSSNVGIDIKKDYHYIGVSTISHAIKSISKLISGYRSEYGNDTGAPKIVIAIDSLDMLMSDSELEKYERGEQAADMGQHPKQIKQLLRTVVNDIKSLNISVIVTKQVYRASQQQILQGEGTWVINDAIRYSASLICLLTRLKLKDEATKAISGIRMKCEGFKTRFTKPFQTVTIEVPYESGMDPLSGLLEVALELEVIQKQGNRYLLLDDNDHMEFLFFAKDISRGADRIIEKCEERSKQFLQSAESVEEILEEDAPGKVRREKKAKDKI